MTITGRIYDRLKCRLDGLRRSANLTDDYVLKDRRSGSRQLVVMLAGYKQPLWPFVFPRFAQAVPPGADVCIVSAGKFDPEINELAEEHHWSYLSTKTNDVSLIQNVAIRLHPEADTIIKVDEDIFLTPQTLSETIAYHGAVKSQGIVRPSATAPMLNVNGVCYRPLLRQLGLLEAYERQFGTARCATIGIRATDDAEAARWIWAHTAPLEQTAAKLRRAAEPELMAPVQFSIGVIVFDRCFWDEIGFFPVKRHQIAMRRSTLGADEEYICRMAMFYARPIVICQHALAGHFSFGSQYAGMLELLKSEPTYFQ